MDEMEKMLHGMIYDSSSCKLAALRQKARELCRRFNQSSESDARLRKMILKELLGALGEDCEIQPMIQFDYGCNTFIGNRCYINFNSVFLDCAPIYLGDNVFIGPGVSFFTPLHPLLAAERNMKQAEDGHLYTLEYAKEIHVEENVWICGNVSVLGGTVIGHDSVIGAGSVVTHSIPCGVLAAGNPCRVLRPLSEADKILKDFDL